MYESTENLKGVGTVSFTEPVTPEEEYVFSRDVKCPYCYSKFNTEDVLFRAADPYSDSDISDLEKQIDELETKVLNGSLDKNETEKRSYELKARLEIMRNYVETADTDVADHWHKKGWPETNCRLREFEHGYCEILNDKFEGGTDINNVRSCILKEAQIKKKIRANGFLVSAIDTRGVMNAKKVCPHCKCVLPENYGREDVKFIACIGARGSGKTVFLSKFFEEIEELLMKNAGINVFGSKISDIFISDKKVKKGEKLPDGTDRQTVKPPVDFLFKDGNRYYTFIFYDIAGENCTDYEEMKSRGTFIGNADGIIMLIAPGQIDGINLAENDIYEENRTEEIESVFNAIARAYGIEEQRNNGEKCDVKMAVVLSKSDVYKTATRNGGSVKTSNMNKEIDYNGDVEQQRENLRGDINELLRESILMDSIDGLYENVDYFAVSALGKGAIVQQTDEIDETTGKTKYISIAPEVIEPIKIDEPFIWILSELGIGSYGKKCNILSAISRLRKGLKKWISNN